MRIGIEAQRIFRKKKHGMDMVALELIKQLQIIDTVNEYFIFVNNVEDMDVLPQTNNFTVVQVKASSYPVWEQYYLPKAVKEYQIDVLHCTSNTAPINLNVPLILTLHDIIYLEKWNFTQGTSYQIVGNLYRRWNVPIVVKKAKHIFTVSNFERDRITSYFKFNQSRVSTAYNGVGKHFAPITDKDELQRIKKLYNLPDSYIFFLGNTDPKKNVIGVLKALSILKQNGQLKSKLLMLDINRDYLLNLMKQINDESLMDDIVFSGYVPNKDLPAIYSQASLFLYPSLRESFGIPLLEAMACGAPLITSNTSSMPEIATNAALFVNPFNANEIADAIVKLQNDVNLQNQLVENGFNRVKYFTWENNAKQTIELYQSAIKQTFNS
ncbi:MAG: glycosyltransferase family 4 protein [Candidatus Methylacidiphilales bacterium]